MTSWTDVAVVVSKRSAANNYQKFEVKRAQDLALIDDRRLVYVLLTNENLDVIVTSDVKRTLEGCDGSVIKWPTGDRDERQIDRFFKRLVAAIRGRDACGGGGCASCGRRESSDSAAIAVSLSDVISLDKMQQPVLKYRHF